MDPKDLNCQVLVAAEVKDNIWKEAAGGVTRGPANHIPSLVCRAWGSPYCPELPVLGKQGLLLGAASSSGFGMLLPVWSLGEISILGHNKQLISVSCPPLVTSAGCDSPLSSTTGLGRRWEAGEYLPSPLAFPKTRFRAVGSFQSQGKAGWWENPHSAPGT